MGSFIVKVEGVGNVPRRVLWVDVNQSPFAVRIIKLYRLLVGGTASSGDSMAFTLLEIVSRDRLDLGLARVGRDMIVSADGTAEDDD